MNPLHTQPRAKRLALTLCLGALAAGCGAANSAHGHGLVAGAPLQGQPVGPAGDVSALVASVQPTVVNITVEHIVSGAPDDGSDASPFDSFRGRDRGGVTPTPRRGRQIGAGSGFIVDDAGHVVTNAHVVDGADKVKVKLSDEREFDAKVMGKDERLDIAVLEIQGVKGLPHVTLGSSTALKVGEPVVAIGNAFGLGGTVTSGIVSAKSRAIGAGPYDDFVQTDASINPGNSGGPLFDRRGQVVGMNTAINPNGQGIGFAIPSDAIRDVLPQLLEHGRVRRGQLGAHIQAVNEPLARALALGTTHGALVGDLEKGGPAATAGLHEGDVIASVDGAPVAHANELPRMIARHAPGTVVTLGVMRESATLSLPVTLGELEDERPTQTRREERPAAGKFGIELGDASRGGAIVESVSPNGPAAGSLAPGDVIVEVDHEPVQAAADAASKLDRAYAGKPTLLRVQREGSTRWIAIERGGSR